MRRGDIVTLGRHRLMCGDSTDADDVAALMDGERADMVFTDPPYCSGGFQESGRSSGSKGTTANALNVQGLIFNDQRSTRGYIRLLKTSLGLSGARDVGVFTNWRMWVTLFDLVEDLGFGVRQMVVWDKALPGLGIGWRAQHELILLATNTAAPFDKAIGNQGNVITLGRKGNTHHITEKPVELLEKVLTVSARAQVVYDCFAGSGGTLLACERLNRRAFCMEISPDYCQVIVDRYHAMTKQPALIGAAS